MVFEYQKNHHTSDRKPRIKQSLIVISILCISLVLVSVSIRLIGQAHLLDAQSVQDDFGLTSLLRSRRAVSCSTTCANGGQCIGVNLCQCAIGFTGPTCTSTTSSSCSAGNVTTFSPLFSITFNSGSPTFSTQTPADFGFTTTYTQVYTGLPQDGQFGIMNAIPPNSIYWQGGAPDYTPGDTNGYMFFVNADYAGGEFYRATITGLVVGSQYYVSAYITNVINSGINFLRPDVTFQVRAATGNALLQQTTTGPIPETVTMTWQQYGMIFVAPSTSVVLLMTSNVGGGSGNDLAIDNIELRGCTPSSPLVTCTPSCQNDGACISNNVCSCADGYTGTSCETPIPNYCPASQLDTSTPIRSVTFGSGAAQYSTQTPASLGFSTTYTQVFSGIPQDGQFALVNSIPDNSGAWHAGFRDRTLNDGNDGYMFLVNADYRVGQFYNATVTGLTVGNVYKLSAYLANVIKPGGNYMEPYVTFQVRSTTPANILYDQVETGAIPEYAAMVWQKYGLTFLATQTSVVLLMISSAGGGSGSDLAIDDIEVRECVPINPSLSCSPACQNGGECIGNNVCLCPDGFTGATCSSLTASYCTTAEMDAATPFNTITFGSGTPTFSTTTMTSLGFTTSYTQVYSGIPQDRQLALMNAVPANSNAWLAGARDHTTDSSGEGYMLLVNANTAGGQFANITLSGFTVGLYYRISLYVANIIASGMNLAKPDLTFSVLSTASGNSLVARVGTGPIAETSSLTWQKVDLSFVAPTTSVILVAQTNVASGSSGVDFVLDDITLRTCPPRIIPGD